MNKREEGQAPQTAKTAISKNEQASSWPLAGFQRRFAAGAIDLAIIVFIFEAALLVIAPFRNWIELAANDPVQFTNADLLLSLLVYVYYVLGLFWPGKGQTPGYYLLKLQLVDQRTALAPRISQAFLWCVASVLLPVGWVTYWFDGKRRMLHNIFSRTIVIDKSL